MEKILVTGAAGFIGWRTSQKLLEEGRQVIGIDNMNDYYDVKLKTNRLEGLKQNKSFTFYRLDIENLSAMDPIFKDNKIGAVVNLAARAGVRYSIENPHVYMSTNAQGVLNLLELMRKHEVNKLVHASTSSLYAGQKMPFTEDLPVNRPISPYAATKKAAEAMAYAYHYLFGLDISVLRYFTVYGPSGRPDMSIFRFVRWIDEGKPLELFGDGSQSRDFTYIDDIAAGTVKALKEVGYEIINLGGGKSPHTLNYVISLLEELLGKKASLEYRPFLKTDMTETGADITKAGRLLNWKPETDLAEGLKKTVDWYRDNISWLKEVKL
ncbi:MAG TPA: SDR family NAD(P)-dependent oxidoreductase [Dissulfurispiraceae bacterium]|nr:SDR family NAD(P)-dependent oxidoreductase [Dissulfurispiraceae bacterium]